MFDTLGKGDAHTCTQRKVYQKHCNVWHPRQGWRAHTQRKAICFKIHHLFPSNTTRTIVIQKRTLMFDTPESKHGYHTHAHRGEVPRDVDITSTFKRHHAILQTSDANRKVAIPKISCYLSSLQIKARVPPHKHGGKVHVMLTLRERSKFITWVIPISIELY